MNGLASWVLTGLSPERRPRSRQREAESSSTGATRAAPSSRGALPPLSVPPSTRQLSDTPQKGEDRGPSHRGAGSDLLFLMPHVADTRASVLGSDPSLMAARSVPWSAPPPSALQVPEGGRGPLPKEQSRETGLFSPSQPRGSPTPGAVSQKNHPSRPTRVCPALSG